MGNLQGRNKKMEQDETGRNTESTPPRRLKGGYWGVFVSSLSSGTKASLDYDQASSCEVQSIPTNKRESGAILVFYVCFGNIKEKIKAAVTRMSIKEGWSSHITDSQQPLLRTGEVLLAASRDCHVLAEACKAHLQPWVRNS